MRPATIVSRKHGALIRPMDLPGPCAPLRITVLGIRHFTCPVNLEPTGLLFVCLFHYTKASPIFLVRAVQNTVVEIFVK